MSDQVFETTEPENAPDDVAPVVKSDEEDEPLREPGKKALVAERKAREAAEKLATEYAAKLRDIEKAQLSDLERAQVAAREAQEAAAKATTDALRWRVAAQYGISAEDAETFLTGADEATISRQAERLAALTVTPKPAPRPDMSQGAKGSGPTAPAEQFAAVIDSLLQT